MIHRVAAVSCLKPMSNWTSSDVMARDHHMTLNLMEDQMRSNLEMIYQILHVVIVRNNRTGQK